MTKNRIIRGIAFALFYLLFFQSGFSQENFLPGYVVNYKGDTLNGFIDYRNWEKNPDIINFRDAINSIPVVYNAIDLIEFKVKDEIYASGIIDVEVSPSRIEKLQEDPSPQIVADTTFLQTLYKGKRSLYYYYNKSDNKENFYVKQDTVFELLLYKKYLKKFEGRAVVVENKQYLGQLALYLDDCVSIGTKLERTTYGKKGLEKIFRYYYECSEPMEFFQKKVEKVTVEVGVFTGASFSSVKFKGENFGYLENADFNRSANFTAGLFLNLVLPRNQRKWSFNSELLFASYDVKGRAEELVVTGGNSTTTTEIGSSQIKINNLFRFNYPVGNSYLFLNAGISNSFAVSEKNYKMVVWKFNGFETTDEGKALNDTRKYEQGIVLGMGLKYKRYSFEIRFETGNGISDYGSLASSTNRYYLLFGYRLNKRL